MLAQLQMAGMRHLKSLISVMQKENYQTKNTNKRRKY